MNPITFAASALALYFVTCGIVALRQHNKFMRELENRQKRRREKEQRLRGYPRM